MTILKPWGFLALVSLVLLLLIYILKPNFQQKYISSTYIWKLSLKYKKKKLPISKLKNILLIICQVLILTLLTAVLINPVKIIKSAIDNEVILILDASASMRTTYEDETRFDRAVDLALEKLNETFEKDGTVSVVVAASEPYFLVERGKVEDRWEIEKRITDFKDESVCSYGASSLDKATELCQEILIDNPSTEINVFTDLSVDYVPDGINVINVTKNGEYNVSILDAYAEIIENYYSFVVEVASFGRDESIEVVLEVYGSNINEFDPLGTDQSFVQLVDLNNDQPKRIIYINSDIDISDFENDENTVYYQISDMDKIYSYESVLVSIDSDDCFQEDNSFSIYGGTKEPLKVLYCSSSANSFFDGIIYVLRSALKDRFDIQLTEINKKKEIPTYGFDLYIFEHEYMPAVAPKDGVVIYSDPRFDVTDAGFRLRDEVDLRKNLNLTEEETHPILKNVVADNITVSKYLTLANYDAGYKTLMTCDNNPVLLMKDDENIKSILMLFSLHYTNLPILIEFPMLMLNIFDYFLPATIPSNSFEVNDSVTVRSRSQEIEVSAYDSVIASFDSFPAKLSVELPGTYTITQTTYFGKDIEEKIYVKIPKAESNIFNSIETITNPVPSTAVEDFIEDIIFLLTLGLAAFVFLEWLLKGNDAI